MLQEPDDWLIANTEFVVEATGYEKQVLWEKFSKEYEWIQYNRGIIKVIGELDNRPINLHISWIRLNGHLIMFYEGISQVVDHKSIDEWFSKNCCPRWDSGRRLAKVNAMNFHHVLDYIKNG